MSEAISNSKRPKGLFEIHKKEKKKAAKKTDRETMGGFYSGQAGKRSIRDQNKAREKKECRGWVPCEATEQ